MSYQLLKCVCIFGTPHIYNWILLSLKNEGNSDTGDNRDEPLYKRTKLSQKGATVGEKVASSGERGVFKGHVLLCRMKSFWTGYSSM